MEDSQSSASSNCSSDTSCVVGSHGGSGTRTGVVTVRIPTVNLLKNSNTKYFATRTYRLQKELEIMTESPPFGCSASPKDDSLDHWTATIAGPPDSVYEGGLFFLDVSFPDEYPFTPLKIKFLTRIYHCNVSSRGEICMDILKEGWVSSMSLSTILVSIVSLLTDCNPHDPLVGAIAKQYLTDRSEYERVAREWTKKYAT